MKALVPSYIETLKSYVPGKPIETLRRERGIQGEILKMASNENPLGPSPLALQAAQIALSEAHLYPDGAQHKLRARLAQHCHTSVENVVVGNGSNELIELIIRAFAQPGDHAVQSEYAFAVYGICMQTHGVEYTSVPMREHWTHDLMAMAEAVHPETRLVWIANPNNPTASYNGYDEVVAFLKQLQTRGLSPVVIMDEAYIECATADDFPDSLELHTLYPRLISLRTLSKAYGLAGFRVGYAVASTEIAGYLHRIRAPFNVGRIAQAVACAALDDTEHLQRSMALVHEGLVQINGLLAEIEGISVGASQTNFVLCHLEHHSAAEIFDRMLDQGVIVRPLTGFGLPNALRITVGLPQWNVRMAEVLKQALQAG